MSANPAKPPSLRSDAESVIRTLHAAGHIAYLAGGCVRDQLLGLEPKDFDVATDAPPPAIRKLFSQTQAVGAAFGVMLVRVGRSTIEVATFRSDGRYSDGRHPDAVRFASPQEDAQRRDFTINGLFYHVAERRVIDFVGGQADLASRTLRAIGDPQQRFSEDHLRLLRAIRFAARFELTIEPATSAAIESLAPKLISISPERIAEELRIMSAPPTRRRAWQLLREYGLDAVLFRFAPPPTRQAAIIPSLDDATATLPLVLAAAVIERHELAAITAKLIQQYRQALRQGLRWSNAEADAFGDILNWLSSTLRDGPTTLAYRRRWTAMPSFVDSLRLLRAIATSERLPRLAELGDELDRLATFANPLPLITGDDLQNAGFTPGPKFRDALAQTYDAQLEARVASQAEALAYARSILDRSN